MEEEFENSGHAAAHFDPATVEESIPFIFWNTESDAPSRRYWVIAKYHEHGLWLFYWHDSEENWVTFKEVDLSFLMETMLNPRARPLTQQEVPDMYEALRKAGIDS